MSAPNAREESLQLLHRIAVACEQIANVVTRMERARNAAGAGQSASNDEVATDRDLDSQYGNPEVKRDPKRWIGKAYAPCRMSDTEPDYLDVLAEHLAWVADQAKTKNEVTSGGKPRAPYLRKDAARARGWAKRLREGWGQQAKETDPDWVAEGSGADAADIDTAAGGW